MINLPKEYDGFSNRVIVLTRNRVQLIKIVLLIMVMDIIIAYFAITKTMVLAQDIDRVADIAFKTMNLTLLLILLLYIISDVPYEIREEEKLNEEELNEKND